MEQLKNLYNQVINDHRKYPRNKGLIDGYDTLKLKNPSCGDDVTVQLHVTNGVITDVRHEGTGCVICCSSASVMSEVLKGKTLDEAASIIDDFYELIKGNYPDSDEKEERLEDAIVYVNIHNFPPRAKCATLAWRAADGLIRREGNNNE